MKIITLLLVSAILIFSSCTKTVTNPAPAPTIDTLIIKDTLVIRDTVFLKELKSITGLWIGTFTANNEPQAGSLYYSFDIREDGTLLVTGLGADGNTYYSSGTWALVDGNFSGRYTTLNLSQRGAVQVAKAKYNSLTNELTDGTWAGEGNTSTGTFDLTKIP